MAGDTDHGREQQERRSIPPQQVRVGWGDKTISIVGIHTVVVVVLVLALVCMGLLLRESVQGSNAGVMEVSTAIDKLGKIQAQQHLDLSKELQDAFGKMQANQNRVAESMDAQTYLMTKTDSERKMYKLDMPESLRKRIR